MVHLGQDDNNRKFTHQPNPTVGWMDAQTKYLAEGVAEKVIQHTQSRTVTRHM